MSVALFQVGKKAILVIDRDQWEDVKNATDVVIHAKAIVIVLPPTATAAERVDAVLALRGS